MTAVVSPSAEDCRIAAEHLRRTVRELSHNAETEDRHAVLFGRAQSLARWDEVAAVERVAVALELEADRRRK
jgi:hypothetical protein